MRLTRLQQEILKGHLGPFLFCFFTVMFILLMQFLILHIDKLVGKGLALGIVIELILTNLAYMVVLAVPMSVLVASLIAFGRFSEWNELSAVKAAGVNPIRLMTPVMVVALLLFLGLSYFSNNILPESNHRARSLFIDIRMQKPAFDLEPGTFYTGIEGNTFLVDQIDHDSDTLRNITLFREEEGERGRATIQARTGWLESPNPAILTLWLEDGHLLQYPPGSAPNPDRVERFRFERHRISFDLSELSFSRTNPEQRNRNDRTMSSRAMLAVVDTLRMEKERELETYLTRTGNQLTEERSVNDTGSAGMGQVIAVEGAENSYTSRYRILNTIESDELKARIASQAVANIGSWRSEMENLQQNLRWRDQRMAEYLVEVHKKFSIPFACILFVFLGAPIGMLTRKGNIGVAALISATLLTLYFLAIIQGEKWADRLVIPPWAGMWGINILMALAGAALTLRVSSEGRWRRWLPWTHLPNPGQEVHTP
ncbi:MAG: LptF/LptG family permease [Balneolaceae bacterium]